MGLSRRQFLHSTTLLGAAVAAGCATAVSGEPRPDPAAVRGGSATPGIPAELTVGIIPYRPYTIEDGDLTGPVPEVARAVLTAMGSVPKFTVVRDQEQLVTGIVAEQFGMVAGLTMRGDLCDQLVYSTPDHVSGTAFAVLAGNPQGLRTYDDVIAKDATVAVFTGFPEDGDVEEAGVPDGNVERMVFSDPLQFVDVLADGDADCFAYDDISLRDMVKESGAALEVTEPFTPPGRLPFVGAYAFPRSSPVVETFNSALRELHDSGEWERIVTPFGFTQFNAPAGDPGALNVC
jgi:polar amino acid transport system substrate-binding protein